MRSTNARMLTLTGQPCWHRGLAHSRQRSASVVAPRTVSPRLTSAKLPRRSSAGCSGIGCRGIFSRSRGVSFFSLTAPALLVSLSPCQLVTLSDFRVGRLQPAPLADLAQVLFRVLAEVAQRQGLVVAVRPVA